LSLHLATKARQRLIDAVTAEVGTRQFTGFETTQELAELETASEDEFTEKVLVPLFQRLGFHRVSPTGHAEKALEFGKDLWMKYQLPTSHWIYFCADKKGQD
jgi:hypothetical protein